MAESSTTPQPLPPFESLPDLIRRIVREELAAVSVAVEHISRTLERDTSHEVPT